jgi:hypothetical protein
MGSEKGNEETQKNALWKGNSGREFVLDLFWQAGEEWGLEEAWGNCAYTDGMASEIAGHR